MSYPEMVALSHSIARKSNFADTGMNLAAAAASYGGYYVMRPVSLKRVMMFISTQVTAGTTAPAFAVYSAPTVGSTSGATSLVTLTIPNGTTAGAVVYKDLSDSTRVNAGNELLIYHSVAAADSGTAAGVGFVGLLFEDSPDADANQSALVKSA